MGRGAPWTFTAGSYDTGTTQVGKMPGYLGLRLVQNFNKITDANLLVPHQIQEAKSRIVAESLKKRSTLKLLSLAFMKIIIYVLTNVSSRRYSRFTEYVSRGGKP
jgi:hypothetical protein